MEIWIIQDGKKTGPLSEFEVRTKIHSGALSGDTPAWHGGMTDWQPLSQLPLFAREFELSEPPASPEPPAVEAPAPPPLPSQAHLIRRFWARWFDLYLFAGFWWLAMWASGRNIGETLQNPWIILSQYIPWFMLESFLLHRFGFTPGKWLLGIRVRNDDGSPLSLAQSTRRSIRVLFLGIGFGWGIIALICQTMAFFTTKRLGRPLWDLAGGHRLETTPLSRLRVAAYVIGLFVALQLQMLVVGPHVYEQMKQTFPSLREHLEENPPWHLPENRS